MIEKRDGGPAFPKANFWVESEGGCGEREQEGMSLRDWFAGRAPEKPQAWFKPTLPPRPVAEWADESDKDNDNRAPINHRALAEWDDFREREFYIQWPWAWADAMLAERDRMPTYIGTKDAGLETGKKP